MVTSKTVFTFQGLHRSASAHVPNSLRCQWAFGHLGQRQVSQICRDCEPAASRFTPSPLIVRGLHKVSNPVFAQNYQASHSFLVMLLVSTVL